MEQQQMTAEQKIQELERLAIILKARVFDAEEKARTLQEQLQQNGMMVGHLLGWIRTNVASQTRARMKEEMPFLGDAVDDMPQEQPANEAPAPQAEAENEAEV